MTPLVTPQDKRKLVAPRGRKKKPVVPPEINLGGDRGRAYVAFQFGLYEDPTPPDTKIPTRPELIKAIKKKARENGMAEFGKLCLKALDAFDLLEDPSDFVKRASENESSSKDFIFQVALKVFSVSSKYGVPVPLRDAIAILKIAGLDEYIAPDWRKGSSPPNQYILQYKHAPEKLKRHVKPIMDVIKKHRGEKRYSGHHERKKDIKKAYLELFKKPIPEEFEKRLFGRKADAADARTDRHFAEEILAHGLGMPPAILRKYAKKKHKPRIPGVNYIEEDPDIAMCVNSILGLCPGSRSLYGNMSPALLFHRAVALTLSLGGEIKIQSCK